MEAPFGRTCSVTSLWRGGVVLTEHVYTPASDSWALVIVRRHVSLSWETENRGRGAVTNVSIDSTIPLCSQFTLWVPKWVMRQGRKTVSPAWERISLGVSVAISVTRAPNLISLCSLSRRFRDSNLFGTRLTRELTCWSSLFPLCNWSNRNKNISCMRHWKWSGMLTMVVSNRLTLSEWDYEGAECISIMCSAFWMQTELETPITRLLGYLRSRLYTVYVKS